jgi:hypothetical protein
LISGELSGAERDAMAKYLLNVPYPPSPERPYTDVLTASARAGINKFHFEKQCANCHLLPFWTTTNMCASGVDVPSWRGANDRWKNAIQNRFFFADLVGGDTRGFPERFSFISDQDMFQMIVEGGVGFSGALGRQLTLNPETVQSAEAIDLLNALEFVADEGGVVLQGEGLHLGQALTLQYSEGEYTDREDANSAFTRPDLLDLAASGDLLLTITARLGFFADYDHPQPTLRPVGLPILPVFPGARPAEFPELASSEPMRLQGEHVQEGAYVLVDGRRMLGTASCERGTLPDCQDDFVVVVLDELPPALGMHLLQVQNPEGFVSNEFVFFVLATPPQATSGNLIASGGTFDARDAWSTGLANASVTFTGEADFTIDAASSQPWQIQLAHTVAVDAGVEYSICYDAKASASRYLQVNVDSGPGDYHGVMGTGFTAEVGLSVQGTGAPLTQDYHQFRHRFVSIETDDTARIVFNLAQSDEDVQIDNVGLYEGRGCGTPSPPTPTQVTSGVPPYIN